MEAQTTHDASLATAAAQFVVLPAASGNYPADNRRGAEHADALVKFIRDAEMPSLLGHVIKAAGVSGRWGGVEVGFTHRLAEFAIAAR